MVRAFALFATMIAIVAIATIAAVAYHRDKERRFEILKELEGDIVVLGIATDVKARALSYVCARIIAVPSPQYSESIDVDILGFDHRPDVLAAPWFANWWNKNGVFMHDILSIETPAGVVHRF
jgi:hypothetical protein